MREGLRCRNEQKVGIAEWVHKRWCRSPKNILVKNRKTKKKIPIWLETTPNVSAPLEKFKDALQISNICFFKTYQELEGPQNICRTSARGFQSSWTQLETRMGFLASVFTVGMFWWTNKFFLIDTEDDKK